MTIEKQIDGDVGGVAAATAELKTCG